SSNCGSADWGGFLLNNSCGEKFGKYLYALGRQTNRTGKIFLDSAQQDTCLTLMTSSGVNASGCGIEKLTSGNGGCSDFSVSNILNAMGHNFRDMNENCQRMGLDGQWDQSCDSCIRSWKGMGRVSPTDDATVIDQKNICRFAVLQSLISGRIEDLDWIHGVYRCLAGQQDINVNQTANQGAAVNQTANQGAAGGLKTKNSKAHMQNTRLRSLAFSDPYLIYFHHSTESNNPELGGSSCLKVPIKEVYAATDNLSEKNFIGEGTAGKVYKGRLSNNHQVAVKHIIHERNVDTFIREITSLSHVKHPNLVSLLAYSKKDNECFLVYELCPNGNLSEWLFGKEKVLSWIQRLEIAVDSARGLWFLHTYPEGCIVHRDIKPTNILLGANFQAKLSDFGLSKVIGLENSYESSEVRGTFGYVDPEYQNNHRVNSLGDVYSFGIVLLQILSGKKVINLNMKKPMSLDKMAKAFTRMGSIIEFADPKLEGDYSAEAFDLTLKLALSCTALKSVRPSMEQVVAKLEKALDISTRAKACTPDSTPNRIPNPQ
ncbi:SPARK domain, partial [Dillenia turbinata]